VIARETQFSGFIAPNRGIENPGPLPVAVLAASLVCEKWPRLACVILASQLPVVCFRENSPAFNCERVDFSKTVLCYLNEPVASSLISQKQ